MNQSIEERLQVIEDRNRRVEDDKAWETSWIRRGGIMVLTYIVVVAYLQIVIKADDVWINALVPVIGFTLSTLTLSLIKRTWLSSRGNK